MTQTIAVADLRPGDCYTVQLSTGRTVSQFVTDVLVSEHAVTLHTLRHAFDAVDDEVRLFPVGATLKLITPPPWAECDCGAEDGYHWDECATRTGRAA
jgi:hypothetical protein